MKLPDKLYDVLKWLAIIVFPALASFYAVLADALSLPYSDIVAKITAGVCTLIGAIIGISTAEYRRIPKENDGFKWNDPEL